METVSHRLRKDCFQIFLTDFLPLHRLDEPNQHASDSCLAVADKVQLNQKETILYKVDNPSDDSPKYFQAHGIIMVFAWIFFASTGILMSRYFKKSWSGLFCGEAPWFAGHRFFMSIVTVLTIIGFLFVLVALGGTWPPSTAETKHFIHTVTGAMVIGFAFFQPFIALFRCKPDSHYRFIYNYLHGFFGYSALILSIVTIFLASFFRLFKNDGGRIVMTIWSVWIVLIFGIFEFLQIYARKRTQGLVYANVNKPVDDIDDSPTSPNVTLSRSSNEQETTSVDKMKSVLLVLHIIVAATLSIVMSVLIG